jgi:histidinol-phosphate/aromatic aminotransferase/cobyric acid decarboxylase-like protein
MVDGSFGAQGGDLRNLPPGKYIDLSTCVNRYGPSPAAIKALGSIAAEDLRIHPYGVEMELVDAYSKKLHVDASELIAGRGTTEFIWSLSRVVPHCDVAIPLPSYTDFLRAFPGRGLFFSSTKDRVIPNIGQIVSAISTTKFVVIANPNNPCGTYIEPDEIAEACRRFPDHMLVVDESYIDFLPSHESKRSLIGEDIDNILVLQSPSKFYGIAGARTGVAWTRNKEMRDLLFTMQNPWPLSLVDVKVAVAALRDQGWASSIRDKAVADGRWLEHALEGLNVEHARVHYRFFFTEKAESLRADLLKSGIVVRVFGNAHGVRPGGIRISAPRCEEKTLVEDQLRLMKLAH